LLLLYIHTEMVCHWLLVPAWAVTHGHWQSHYVLVVQARKL